MMARKHNYVSAVCVCLFTNCIKHKGNFIYKLDNFIATFPKKKKHSSPTPL